jgi:hypothetical protein
MIQNQLGSSMDDVLKWSAPPINLRTLLPDATKGGDFSRLSRHLPQLVSGQEEVSFHHQIIGIRLA